MNPHLQHTASIANLLAYIDGSSARACLDCGTIFMVPAGSARMRCEPCQCKAEEGACCDNPEPRTVAAMSADDGTTFVTTVCSGCGKRTCVEA